MQLLRILGLAALFLTISGCLETDPQLTAWQRQRVQHAEQQAAQSTAAAKALVEADARARQELAALERDLQTERAEVGRQRDVLEVERKDLATERQRAPIIAAAIQRVGLLVLAAMPLLICWLLLRGPHLEREATELEEILVMELAAEASPLLPANDLLSPPSQPAPKALKDRSAVEPDEEPPPTVPSDA